MSHFAGAHPRSAGLALMLERGPRNVLSCRPEPAIVRVMGPRDLLSLLAARDWLSRAAMGRRSVACGDFEKAGSLRWPGLRRAGWAWKPWGRNLFSTEPAMVRLLLVSLARSLALTLREPPSTRASHAGHATSPGQPILPVSRGPVRPLLVHDAL